MSSFYNYNYLIHLCDKDSNLLVIFLLSSAVYASKDTFCLSFLTTISCNLTREGSKKANYISEKK